MSQTQLQKAQISISSIHSLLISEKSPEAHDELAKALFVVTRGTRWNLLNDETSLDDIWKNVRENELLTDYVLRGTTLFLSEVGYIDGDIDRVIGQVSLGLGWVESSSFVDNTLTERCGDKVWFARVFKCAPWLLFLYLLSTISQV
jgi:hypothetical protein